MGRACPLILVSLRLAWGSLPVSFEPNQGQTAPQVQFLARLPGYTLFVTSQEAVFAQSGGSVQRMRWMGANPAPRAEPLDKLPGISNYFLGNDPRNWRTGVPQYARFALREVYPGIDLVFYSTKDARLEYDWVVAPGADPKQIRVQWESRGEPLRISKTGSGDLLLNASLRQQRPSISQNGRRIEGGYAIDGNQVRFEIPSYDAAQPLLIDPVMLVYSTYLGGRSYSPANMGDVVQGIAVDGSGNAYVAGSTASTNFPLTSPLQDKYEGDVDAFVTEIAAGGTMVVYSTYVGGSSTDAANGIAVDASGNAYIAGSTLSDNFPVVHALQPNNASAEANGFVAKISAGGSMLAYSTYLGGSENQIGDWANAIAVDAAGNAYVTGISYSKDFPTVNAIQGTNAGAQHNSANAFVTKLNPSGSQLVYSTFLGGSGSIPGWIDSGSAIAVDLAGAAYLTGPAGSLDFPLVNPIEGAYPSAATRDGSSFVTKINPAGTALVYSTYLGGNNRDGAAAIAVDNQSNAYIAGFTGSRTLPTTQGAFQSALPNTQGSGFVAKINAAGSAFSYYTYLGGNQGSSNVNGIAVDSTGSAYVTGGTASSSFPQSNALQSYGDIFVAKLNPGGTGLVYSTLMGGATAGTAYSTSIAIDPFGNAYVGGVSRSQDFPIVSAIQPTNYRGTLGTGAVFEIQAFPAALVPPAGMKINSGSGQTEPAGTQLPGALSVLVTGSAGTPVAGVTVNFAIASGSGTLSAASAQTDSNGKASVALTVGFVVGPVTVTAAIAGSSVAPVTFTETVTANPACPIGPPVISSVNSATDFGGFSNFASGSYLEVKGSNLALDMRQWASSDFSGSNAPNMLDGTQVMIDSIPGYVSYINGQQVNVQAPADIATGMVPVTVTNCAGSSNTVLFQKNALSPGMLAPAAFNLGKQYLAALFAADLNQGIVTYAGNPGLIAGANFRPAKQGDIIIMYGLGFGSVTPATPPGVIASGGTLSGLSVSFGQTPATIRGPIRGLCRFVRVLRDRARFAPGRFASQRQH